MSRKPQASCVRLSRTLIVCVSGFFTAQRVHAHDGHAPLPTKGATVQGMQLLLSEPARKAIGVETAKIKLASLEKTIHAQCQAQLPWHQQAQVTALLAGRIRKVMAKPGDVVERGQELALINSLEFETIQRNLLKAHAAKTLAERLLKQREELARSNTITEMVLLESRREVGDATAKVEIATRKLMAIGLPESAIERVVSTNTPIESLSIRSPMRGEIANTDIRSGQVVARDEHLFHVVDLSALEFAGQAIESDVPDLKIGQPISAEFLSLPGQTFSGELEHTRLEVDQRLRTLMVIAHAQNPERRIKPGMSGRMAVSVAHLKDVIVCPIAAVSGTPKTPFVFLEVAAGRYDLRPVTLGARVGSQVEVLDGLFPGDKVVVVGTGLITALFPPLAEIGETKSKLQISQALIETRAKPELAGKTGSTPVVALGEVELPLEQRHYAAAQMEGRIARILVHPGQQVKAGQVLAEVESLPVFELQLELLQNQAKAKWIREKTVRLRALEQSQAVKKIDLWQAETDLDVIEHTIDEIRAKLKALGLDQASLNALEANGLDPSKRASSGSLVIPVRAPASGQLDHFEVVPGQVVRPSDSGQTEPSEPLFEIQDRSKVWVCAHVRERDTDRIQKGMSATVSFPAIPGKSVQGSVVRTSPVFDSKSHAMSLWVEVANPDGHLFENMQAKVVINPAPAPNQTPAPPR